MRKKLMSPLVLVGQLLGLLPAMSFPALAPDFAALWSLSGAQVGWVVASYFLGYLSLLLFVMPITDRRDGRMLVIGGSLLSAVATLAFPLLADGFYSAMALRFLSGASHGIFYSPTMRALSDRLEEPTRSKVLTIYTANYSVGAGLSFAVAGIVAENYDWHVAYYAIAAASALSSLMFALAFGPKAPVAPPSGRHPLDYRPILANRRALGWIVANMGHGTEFSVMRNWLVALFTMSMAIHGARDMFGVSPAWISAFIATLSLPSILLGGGLARRYGDERAMLTLMLVTLSLAALMCLSILLALPLWVVALLAAAYSMFISSDAPIIIQGGMKEARPGELGMIMAAQTSLSFVASIPGPVIFGLILDLCGGSLEPAGWSIGYILFSLTALGSGLLAIRMRRKARP